MTDKELLQRATSFLIWSIPDGATTISVEKRGDDDSWAVCGAVRTVYSRSKNEFIHEPLPSSRTDRFLKDTRFVLKEAVRIAEEISKAYQSAYDEWKNGNKSRYFPPECPASLKNKRDSSK